MKQLERCRKHHVRFVPSPPCSNIQFALETMGRTPVNGLRQSPYGDSNGWYIWCGQELPEAPDSFIRLRTIHLADCCPDAIEFLGLPPGYRFTATAERVDVWPDPKFGKTS